MRNNTLTDKKYWDAGYKDFSFSAMPKNYPLVKEIYKNFSRQGQGEVLEIGCFPGRFLYHFGKLGYNLNGLDQTNYLNDLVNWLNENCFKVGSFIKEDIFNISFDKKYDIVFSSGFIEHFVNFEEVIGIHCKLVKPGGYIFITTPNFAGVIQKKLHLIFDRKNIDRHYLPAMNPNIWYKDIQEKGFRIIKSGYIGGFDFWVGNEERSLWKRIIIKIMLRLLPIRWLPDSEKYSPEIYIIAQKTK